MKKIYFIILVFILPFASKAQGVFGGTHASVRDTLIKNNFKYIKSDKAKDNTIYDEYNDADGVDVVVYFNSSGNCYQFRRYFNRTALINEVEYLNKKFIKVDKNNWINAETTTKIYIQLPEDGDIFFSVSFVSMITPQN